MRVQDAVIKSSPARHRLRGRLVAFGAGIAAAVLAVITLNMSGVIGERSVTPPVNNRPVSAGAADSDGVELESEPGEPCPGAKRHSLPELAALADVPVWMPNSTVASPTTFDGAWTCIGGNTPLLTFGPVMVSFESGWGDVDAQEKWTGMVEEFGEGRVETILGEPALVEPVTADAPKGQVLLIVNGDTLIRVLGDGSVPVSQLADVARSIDLETPVTPN